MKAAWLDFLNARGAQVREGTVLDFGNPDAELAAAAQGDIIADLSHLSLLQIMGLDAATFLQGQLTNDIKGLDGSNSQYTGHCMAKGRLLALFLAFMHHGHYHMQCNGALGEQVAKRLRMYVLRSKVTITDVSDDLVRLGLSGANAPAAVERLFGAVPQTAHQLADFEIATVLRLPGTTPRFEIFAQLQHATGLWDALTPDFKPAGKSCWDWLEIRAGIPDITPATQEAFVPQMVNLDALGGISYTKGCYIGQEIVARTHYLGKVKRRTQLAHVATAELPAPGTLLFGTGSTDPAGMVVSAARAPGDGCDLLAELRLESIEAGPVHLGSAEGPQLELQPLPYPL